MFFFPRLRGKWRAQRVEGGPLRFAVAQHLPRKRGRKTLIRASRPPPDPSDHRTADVCEPTNLPYRRARLHGLSPNEPATAQAAPEIAAEATISPQLARLMGAA